MPRNGPACRGRHTPDMTVTASAGTPAFFSSFCICGTNACHPCRRRGAHRRQPRMAVAADARIRVPSPHSAYTEAVMRSPQHSLAGCCPACSLSKSNQCRGVGGGRRRGRAGASVGSCRLLKKSKVMPRSTYGACAGAGAARRRRRACGPAAGGAARAAPGTAAARRAAAPLPLGAAGAAAGALALLLGTAAKRSTKMAMLASALLHGAGHITSLPLISLLLGAARVCER